ncbi:MAG TPA: glucosaminidase domain-containing protein, partial [Chitinophagaceae bacterium]
MKKIFAVLVFCLVVSGAFAQDKVEEYIRTYQELAIKEMLRTGVPAAITLAQGILESQSGESDLARKSNNHFGIKCKNDWTGATVYHDDDARGECFRSYDNAEQSYRDHSDFLKSRPHYTFLFSLDPTDFEGWAKGLKKAGYATSPTYADRLIGLIRRYNLQEYTLVALNRKKGNEDEMFSYAKDETPDIPEQPADTTRDVEAVAPNSGTGEAETVPAAVI